MILAFSRRSFRRGHWCETVKASLIARALDVKTKQLFWYWMYDSPRRGSGVKPWAQGMRNEEIPKPQLGYAVCDTVSRYEPSIRRRPLRGSDGIRWTVATGLCPWLNDCAAARLSAARP